jgi:hypothetical protein
MEKKYEPPKTDPLARLERFNEKLKNEQEAWSRLLEKMKNFRSNQP